MRPAAAAPLLLLAAAAGCATAAGLADPPLAQLARWRATGPEAIAAEPVVAPCPAGNPACPRLHALRAEACLGQALARRAPGAACPASRAAPLLDCAAEGYAAALAAGAAGAPVLRAGQAQALLCRAELDEPAAALLRARAAAEAAAGAPPGLAALHGARAALLLARIGADLSESRTAAGRAGDLSESCKAADRAGTPSSLRGATCAADDFSESRKGARAAGDRSEARDAARTATGSSEHRESASATGHPSEPCEAAGGTGHPSEGREASGATGHPSEPCEASGGTRHSSESREAARRALGLSGIAPVEHRARLRADALPLLRSCETPAR